MIRMRPSFGLAWLALLVNTSISRHIGPYPRDNLINGIEQLYAGMNVSSLIPGMLPLRRGEFLECSPPDGVTAVEACPDNLHCCYNSDHCCGSGCCPAEQCMEGACVKPNSCPNACGSICAGCPPEEECNSDGQCVKRCPNACGQTCGGCLPGEECNSNGQCVKRCPNACGQICDGCLPGEECNSDGQCVKKCPNACGQTCDGCLPGEECNSNGQCVKKCPNACGQICDGCLPGEECNSDGQCVKKCPNRCGDSCEGCPTGRECKENACVDTCPNRCGDQCSGCSNGETCENNQCIRPQPTCSNSCGEACCSSGQTCVGGQCCTNACGNGCCSNGEKCIDGQCCANACGEQCSCSDGEYCVQGRCSSSTTPTTIPTSTSISTTSPTTTTASTTLPPPSANSPAPLKPVKSSPVTERTPVATLRLDFNQVASGSRQLSKDLQSQRQQAATKLFEGICKGLDETSSAILSFTNDLKTQKSNRLKSGCASKPCKGNPNGAACMQFPFASTLDAVSQSSWTCVPKLAQYFQGAILSDFRNRSGITTGQAYKISLSGFNCQTMISDTRRGLFRRDVPELEPGTTQSGEMESFPPFTSESSLNTVIVSLGDMLEGTYNIQTQVNSGKVETLSVSDSEGNQFGSLGTVGTSITSGQHGIEFSVPDGAMEVGCFLGTSDPIVNVAATLKTIRLGPNSASAVQSTRVYTTLIVILAGIWSLP